jgi:uncharacterized membrane protein
MNFLLFALIVGVIAGLRAFTAPTLVSWLAHLGYINLTGTPLAFFGYAWTPWIFSALAVGELITDQLPSTPSRTSPQQFGARIVSGAVAGGAIGAAQEMLISGVVVGIVGATIGTLGGHGLRVWLAKLFGNDHPAALVEDAITLGGALLIGLSAT